MLEGHENDPLIAALRASEDRNKADFWCFKEATQRSGAHALLHYPAMMVPSLQGLIMQCAKDSQPDITTILDPFVGSGTALVEAMERGLNFKGLDINPLAGLACLAKSGPLYISALKDKSMALLAAISSDHKTYTPREFPGRDKWFDVEVSQSLEKISHHIQKEPSKWARRLFWLALCHVVRSTCKSRKSTYKLHIEAPTKDRRIPDTHTEFSNTLKHFEKHLAQSHEHLTSKQLLSKGRYVGTIDVNIGDNKTILEKESSSQPTYDYVMTSPPYGDNSTTIPYGQFSYLQLQWVNLDDIDMSIDPDLVVNTHSADTASLGGSLRGAKEKAESLGDRYETAATFLGQLNGKTNGQKRFAAFFYDLEKSVDEIVKVTRPNGIHSWTIANRRICGLEAPMVSMMQEMLNRRGVHTIGTISRGIHGKKMAARNSITSTMTSETILLARKEVPA